MLMCMMIIDALPPYRLMNLECGSVDMHDA